jgi:hypothetical protein
VVRAVQEQAGRIVHAQQNVLAGHTKRVSARRARERESLVLRCLVLPRCARVCVCVCPCACHTRPRPCCTPPRAQIELDGLLSRILPHNLTRFFYCNSGSEAVENAVKIARAVTGRQDIIAFDVSGSGAMGVST